MYPLASTSRTVTPPPQVPHNPHPTHPPLTPEQIRQVEVNRLKAKARQRELDAAASAAASSSSNVNVNNKRPLAVIPAASTSLTGPVKTQAPPPLQRDTRLMGKYFDYDLSKMVNSKGGFLVEDDNGVDDAQKLKERQRERERERAMQALEPPPIFLDPTKNPKCRECNSVDVDHTFKKVFNCIVCEACKKEKPEKYSLLTKTECKEDYLLTDPELRDQEAMPHLLKANPHKSTYSNMMLFLRYQVEEFAWKKWGSAEALDAEYERRTNEKKRQKNKKFEEGLRDLRRRTKESVWQHRRDVEHKHIFGPVVREGDLQKQICHECGFQFEVEEF